MVVACVCVGLVVKMQGSSKLLSLAGDLLTGMQSADTFGRAAQAPSERASGRGRARSQPPPTQPRSQAAQAAPLAYSRARHPRCKRATHATLEIFPLLVFESQSVCLPTDARVFRKDENGSTPPGHCAGGSRGPAGPPAARLRGAARVRLGRRACGARAPPPIGAGRAARPVCRHPRRPRRGGRAACGQPRRGCESLPCQWLLAPIQGRFARAHGLRGKAARRAGGRRRPVHW